jgi:hypothetical protein
MRTALDNYIKVNEHFNEGWLHFSQSSSWTW